jgi:beta-glucosidase-like glycosyl hydrolase
MHTIFWFSILLASALSLAAKEPTMNEFTLREKITQTCFVAVWISEERDQEVVLQWKNWQPRYHLERKYVEQLIQEERIGGKVLYGKNALPEEAIALISHFQSLSKTPLFIALDAELGLGSRFDSKHVIRFPTT